MDSVLADLPDILPAGEFRLARWLFLRALGLIFVAAFLSLWAQVRGLIGEKGILPAREYLEGLRRSGGRVGASGLPPTLFRLRADDRALEAGCAAGVVVGLALTAGIAPAACLLLLWALYLSYAAVGQVFLSYQWDVLLLEAGFTGVLLAPWRLWPGDPVPAVPTGGLLLAWWLLFRLHVQSGVGKLQSGDRTWRDLTALYHHFCTQPLPNPVAWYAHRLPAWLQRAAAAGTHVLEIGWPFLIFLGPEARLAAFAGLALLQAAIFLTGNYTFFNLLALALCLLLLPDATWAAVLPETALGALSAVGAPVAAAASASPPAPAVVHRIAVLGFGGIMALASLAVLWRTHVSAARLPGVVERFLKAIQPYRIVNSYGLFRVMTTERPEIVVEGSRDGRSWEAYEFRYKPGDPERPPPWIAPHQPRLDWQMWFAALGSWERTRWLHRFLARLLEGSEPVLDLLESSPFEEPPRFVRTTLYDYRFTTPDERRETGRWWRRERLGPYGPVLSRSGSRPGSA